MSVFMAEAARPMSQKTLPSPWWVSVTGGMKEEMKARSRKRVLGRRSGSRRTRWISSISSSVPIAEEVETTRVVRGEVTGVGGRCGRPGKGSSPTAMIARDAVMRRSKSNNAFNFSCGAG